MTRLRFFPLLLALLVPLLFAACAAPLPASEPIEEIEPVAPAFPAYETFDPSGYDAQPARQERTAVEHDAPPELMAGTIVDLQEEEEGPRTVQGFRVQLFTSESKTSADAVRDDALSWWRSAQTDEEASRAFPHGLQPAVIFSRPFYRVRVGGFESRMEAEAALVLLRERYPEAFIVPDVVTLGGS